MAWVTGWRGGHILDTVVVTMRVLGGVACGALANLIFVKATNSLSGGVVLRGFVP